MSTYLAYLIALAAAGLTVLLTLQRRRWIWQSRIIGALLPFAIIVLDPTHNSTVDIALCGLALFTTGRAVQTLLPSGETIRGFVTRLRPGGNRHLFEHLMHYVTLRVAGLVLLFKHAAGDEAAEAAIREKRIVARDAALEAQHSIPGALGFSRLHWIVVAEIFAVWLILQLTHLASPAATFSLAVPVVLVTAAYILHGRAPGFAAPAASPHTSITTTTI